MIEKKINYTTKTLENIKYKNNLDIEIIEDEFNNSKYTKTYKIRGNWYDEDELIKQTYKLAKEFSLQFESSRILIETSKQIHEELDNIWLETKIIISLTEVC